MNVLISFVLSRLPRLWPWATASRVGPHNRARACTPEQAIMWQPYTIPYLWPLPLRLRLIYPYANEHLCSYQHLAEPERATANWILLFILCVVWLRNRLPAPFEACRHKASFSLLEVRLKSRAGVSAVCNINVVFVQHYINMWMWVTHVPKYVSCLIPWVNRGFWLAVCMPLCCRSPVRQTSSNSSELCLFTSSDIVLIPTGVI